MKKININEWVDFKVYDIFKTKGKPVKTATGASISLNSLEVGETPRITVTNKNNGIVGYYQSSEKYIKNYRTFKNFISVSFLGTVFYHDYKASVDMKVHVLEPINTTLDKYLGMFLVSVIKASLRKFSYSDQISSKVLASLTLKLPVDSLGNPDWHFMRDIICKNEPHIKERVVFLNKINNKSYRNKIVISDWKEFMLEDLFDVIKGSRLTKKDMVDGSINYVGASAFNNGITNSVGNIGKLHPKGVLTVCYNGSIGETFYQSEVFWATDDVNIFYPRFEMSEDVAMFLIPIIKKMGLNYAFLDKWTMQSMKSTKIPLPVNEHGSPNWEYMASFIKKSKSKALDNIGYFLSSSRLKE